VAALRQFAALTDKVLPRAALMRSWPVMPPTLSRMVLAMRFQGPDAGIVPERPAGHAFRWFARIGQAGEHAFSALKAVKRLHVGAGGAAVAADVT
jgi:hypothetical protein